jgi:3-oxoacyl-[acyl-carrier-protein] synthase II
LGHLISTVGAVESLACVLALQDGVMPPTLNLQDADPGVQLDVVTGSAREVELSAAVNNSWGFGGHNVALASASA